MQELQLLNQQAIDQSERKYRELVQNAKVILIRLDETGSLTFINDYALDFFGWSEPSFPKIDMSGRVFCTA